MHAAVLHVSIDPKRIDDAEKELHATVIPRAKSAKGFVSGVWSHSPNGKGVGVVVFENEQDASDFVSMAQAAPAPDDSPVTVESVEVSTVAGTA